PAVSLRDSAPTRHPTPPSVDAPPTTASYALSLPGRSSDLSRSEFSGSTAAKYAAPASSVSRHSLTIHLNSLTLVASPILPFSLPTATKEPVRVTAPIRMDRITAMDQSYVGTKLPAAPSFWLSR